MSTVNLIGVILDPRAQITYCNDYFLELTGWKFVELEGRSWYAVFVPPSIEDLTGLTADLLDDKPSARHHENDILTRSGERRSIRWNNMVLRDPAGAVVGVASIGEDVTERLNMGRELLDSSARERRHLQSELHDGLGQELFGVAIVARSLATTASREGLAIADELARLSTIASNAIETCRRIARGFSPLSDLQGGLFHALKELANVPAGREGPRVEFCGSDALPLRLGSQTQDHLYRIAQEAITNAVKHAGARTIRISLDVQPKKVTLAILDDGIGLPAGYDAGSGLGLRIMRYRADLIRGQLRIGRRAEGGTEVMLTCQRLA